MSASRHGIPFGRRARRAAGRGLSVLGFVVLLLIPVVFAVPLRTTVLRLACSATGCGPHGMATAGWLVVAVPLWSAGLCLFLWERTPVPVRLLAALLTVALGLIALAFYPGKGIPLSEALAGRPGATGFATGLRWTAPAVCLSLVGFAMLSFGEGTHYRRGQRFTTPQRRHRIVAGVALVAVLSLAALGIALNRV